MASSARSRAPPSAHMLPTVRVSTAWSATPDVGTRMGDQEASVQQHVLPVVRINPVQGHVAFQPPRPVPCARRSVQDLLPVAGSTCTLPVVRPKGPLSASAHAPPSVVRHAAPVHALPVVRVEPARVSVGVPSHAAASAAAQLPLVRTVRQGEPRQAPIQVPVTSQPGLAAEVPRVRLLLAGASASDHTQCLPLQACGSTAEQNEPQLTRRKKRKSVGSDFKSQAELEGALKEREVDELVASMPDCVALNLLGGEVALQQVPSAERRLQLVKDAVALKAGTDGATLANARRAWEAYLSFAETQGLPNKGIPASAALVATFLREEGVRAAAGKGSQGGSTVGNSRRVGLLWLHQKLGFPLDVDNIVVLGVANPGKQRAHRRSDPASNRRKQAGSIPISAYCQFEVLASASTGSPTRFFARSMLAFSLMQSVRAVDALRTVEDADELEPGQVMSGWSYFSKDGEPMKTFAPAKGFLADLDWWPKHQSDVRAAGRPFPKWQQPWGSKGCVTKATPGPPLDAVMPKNHMVQSIKGCLMAPPLSMSEEQFAAGHHGALGPWFALGYAHRHRAEFSFRPVPA